MKHHGDVAGHELAQSIAVGTVDLAVGFEVDIFAAGDLVDTHRGRQSLAVKKHVVTLHFLDAQGIARQRSRSDRCRSSRRW